MDVFKYLHGVLLYARAERRTVISTHHMTNICACRAHTFKPQCPENQQQNPQINGKREQLELRMSDLLPKTKTECRRAVKSKSIDQWYSGRWLFLGGAFVSGSKFQILRLRVLYKPNKQILPDYLAKESSQLFPKEKSEESGKHLSRRTRSIHCI